MNRATRWTLFLFTLLLAAYVGFRMRSGGSTVRADGATEGLAGSVAIPVPAAPRDEVVTFVPPELGGGSGFEYPRDAIPGEVVLSFADRAAYDAYLAALERQGIRPRGVIDRLLAVRVGADSLAAVDPRDFDASADFSFRVIEPPPPIEMPPEMLATLRPFNTTASGIVGGRITGRGAGVKIAVLDSGFAEHPVFEDSTVSMLDLTGSGIDAAGAEHGTSVASIVAGSDGVAPESELLLMRVLDAEGEGNSFVVAEAIVQAVDSGARVINMSIGVYQDSRVLSRAVEYAYGEGVVMVAAVGNDAADSLMYPAAYPEVVAVTAVDARSRQALFPNRSSEIDIAAPGVGIVAAAVDEEGTAADTLFSGTSAAAPLVSGTLAALMSENPLASGQQVTNELGALLNESGPAGSDPLYGGGVIDFDRIAERGTRDVVDIALADIYIPPATPAGTSVPLDLVIENRGTAFIPEADLEVRVGNGEVETFAIGSLNPGDVTTRTVYGWVPAENDRDAVEALRVSARLLIDEDLPDVRIDNNSRAVQFVPPEP